MIIINKKVKIGIIDSGVDINHTYFYDKSIKSVEIDRKKDDIKWINSYSDESGHGTAIAGIILKEYIDVEILSIKVLNSRLKTSIDDLCTAIQFAIDENVSIINMSLGTINKASSKKIYNICKNAIQKNILIVSAQNNKGKISYPAAFEEVFSVVYKPLSYDVDYYYKDDIKNNIYVNVQKRVISPNQQYDYVQGNSYACAKFTGILSKITSNNKYNNIYELKNYLKENSINYQQYFEMKNLHIYKLKNEKVIMCPVHKTSNQSFKNKNYNVVGFYDTREFFHDYLIDELTFVRIKIYNNLISALNMADTIIIDKLDYIPELNRDNFVQNIVNKSLNMKKNVVVKNIYKFNNYKQLKFLAKKNKVDFIVI